MKWFNNPETLEDLKKQYKKLVFKHHPDKGGKTADMQEINAEYDAKKGSTAMIIIISIFALMLAVALTACIKPGTKDDLSNYGYIEEEKEQKK